MEKIEKEIFLTYSHNSINNKPKIRKSKIKNLIENETNRNNTFDGLAILSHKITVKDEIEKIYSPQPKGRNIIFNKPFPLISVVSKRTLLNKTSNLIPKLINCYKKKLLKQDENLILNLNKKIDLKRKLGDTISQISSHRRIKTCIDLDNKLNQTWRSKPIFHIRTYSRNHDTNLYNMENFVKKPSEFYNNNPFKIKQLINEVNFMSKIKDDVSKLKFNNTLRANLNFNAI